MLKFLKRRKEAREGKARKLALNPEDSSSGKKFKQLYRIGDKLGQGAFSVVKEGTHKQSGKSYAIKIVNKYKLNIEDKAALKEEIRVLHEIHHPHVVDLFDVFDDPTDDYTYLVTEKISGGSLYERIETKGRYNEADGRIACRTLFEAMAFTHEHNVAHRDLKLENLLLPSDLNIKVIDFGFAKKVTSANGLKTFIGTPGYVAPCILEGVGYGTKADVWSLGVVLYCMLGGYPPFRDANRQKLFQKIRQGMYKFHEKKWGDVSDDAKDLIRLLLTVNPAKRVTAKEALQHRWMIGNDTKEESKEEAKLDETKEESKLDEISMQSLSPVERESNMEEINMVSIPPMIVDVPMRGLIAAS